MEYIENCEYCNKECNAETINNTTHYGFLCDECLMELSKE